MRSRRPILVATAVVAAMTLALAGCGDDDDSSDSSAPVSSATFEAGTTMAALNSKGSVTVGTKFDQPLFGLKGLDGKPVGFDVSIAKIIAAKLGIPADKVNFIETPSAVREEVIEQNKVDYVVATYTINEERAKRIGFAGPYYIAGQDLMVAKDNTDITGPESLRPTNAKVCSVTGSTPSEEIKKYVDNKNIVLFDVYSKCADALRNNQVQAVTTDNVILLGLISESPDDFKLAGKPFTKEPYGIGIKKGDSTFCEFINQTLTEAAEDGSYAKAWEDTVGDIAPAPTLPALSCDLA